MIIAINTGLCVVIHLIYLYIRVGNKKSLVNPLTRLHASLIVHQFKIKTSLG